MQARIHEALGDKGPRAKQVLCVEVLLTASPNAFPRDKHGRVGDVRGSAWARDVERFARQRWGGNLVGLMLHQDEVTPHFQGFIVPVTEDNRLSAKSVFTRQSLRELQTDYATAMAGHGQVRGLAGSRASHKSMQEMYARPLRTEAELTHLLLPLPVPTLKLDKPGVTNLFQLERYVHAQQERLQRQADQLAAAYEQRMQDLAQATAALTRRAEQARELQGWLEKEKQHSGAVDKENNTLRMDNLLLTGELRDVRQQLTAEQQRLEATQRAAASKLDALARQAAQDTLPTDFMQRGQRLHLQAGEPVRKALTANPHLTYTTVAQLEQRLSQAGCRLEAPVGQPERVVSNNQVDVFGWNELVPGCQTAAQVVERERRAQVIHFEGCFQRVGAVSVASASCW